MRYGQTLFLLNFDNIGSQLQAGQWVRDCEGSRGQYLGRTDHGTVVVRWQRGKFQKRDAVNNKHLRNFAVTYGSK